MRNTLQISMRTGNLKAQIRSIRPTPSAIRLEHWDERTGSGKTGGTSFGPFAHGKAMAEGAALHHRARAHTLGRGLHQHFTPAPHWLLGVPDSGHGSCLHRHGVASCARQGSAIPDGLDANASLGSVFGRDEHRGLIRRSKIADRTRNRASASDAAGAWYFRRGCSYCMADLHSRPYHGT